MTKVDDLYASKDEEVPSLLLVAHHSCDLFALLSVVLVQWVAMVRIMLQHYGVIVQRGCVHPL